MHEPQLVGFSVPEGEMIKQALDALCKVSYDISPFRELIKVNDMPTGYRAVSLEGGAALGNEAFESQEWLVHVLEEELLHLMQKSRGLAQEFVRGKALELELDVNDTRKFPPPNR